MYRVKTLLNPNILYTFRDYDIKFKDSYAENVPPEIAYHMSRAENSGYVIDGENYPYNSDAWKQEKRLIWSCSYAAANGYGMVAENVVKALLHAGINVKNPKGIAGDLLSGGEYVDESVMKTLNQVIKPDTIEIQHCQPHQFVETIVQRKWIYTMFETTHTPKKWIDIMNRKTEVVLTPSSWLVDIWKEQGLTRPIEVFGHGVDVNYYHYMERPEREIFTFLHYGMLSTRKGSDLVAQAFQDEFRGDKNVRLYLKHNTPMFPVPLHIPNVQYVSATFSKPQMIGMLFNADCLLFPSRGEGFGLPVIEAMSTGLPVITTNWSGMKDFTTPEDTLLLKHRLIPAYAFKKLYESDYEPAEDAGAWADPDYDDLRQKMRWAVDHRAELKEMGRKASARILRDWSWDAKIQELIKIIDKYA